MARPLFKPASSENLRNRAEFYLQEWVKNFELREGVTKRKDGSFDVVGNLDLSVEDVFNKCGADRSLIKKYVRFNKIDGDFIIWSTELFFVLPREVKGDVHIVGKLRGGIRTAGCRVKGRVLVTLEV